MDMQHKCQQKLRHIPMRLDYYLWCAETYREIFEVLKVQSYHTVIDLCPGWSPKIEMALLKTSFSGTVVAVDKSYTDLQYLLLLLTPFNPQFKIKLKQIDLNKEQYNLKGDIIIANHLIDDLLVDAYLSKTGTYELNIFQNSTHLQSIWGKIIPDKRLHKKVTTLLVEILLESIQKQGYIIISQYEGYQEKLYGRRDITKICQSVMIEVKHLLLKTGKFVDYQNWISQRLNELKNPYFPASEIICLKAN